MAAEEQKKKIQSHIAGNFGFKMNIFNASALQIYLNIDSNISSVRYGYDYLKKNLRAFGVLKFLMSILIFQYQHGSNVVICFISKSARLISSWVKHGKFDGLLYLYI